jgi:pilus assembly protein CpaC
MIRLLSLGLLLLLMSSSVFAQATPSFVSEANMNAGMEVGETRLLTLPKPIVRVSVADPNVADVQVVTPSQVLITAKAVGFTHLILWDSAETPLVIAVSATRNLDQLRDQFKSLFSDSNIRVSSVGDLIVLSGSVSDLRLPARAAEVAQLHSEKIANLIQVTGDQQVQLDVRFAEVSRTGLRSMGANFLWQDSSRGYVGGQTPTGVVPGSYLRDNLQVPGTGGGGPPLVGAPAQANAFNLFFSTGLRDFPFSAILSILSQQGLAKVLAEPTLVSLSGQDAEFHAGGEVPILIARDLGSVGIEYKKFGVLLKFNPTVLGERTMSLKLALEVSEPDPSAGVTLGGYRVPGFRTRSSETTVRLRDGQSFAIAGLLSDQSRNLVSKIPVLGDLPILGALFRSTNYQHEETELLMVVTAHLVKPLEPGDVPLLPGEDEYNDPNDFELFLLGKISSDQRESYENGRPAVADPNATAAEVEGNATPAAAPHEGPVGPIGFIRP